MKHILRSLAVSLTIALCAPAAATEFLQISWSDLLPEERQYDDPFLDLPYTQINDLAMLYRIEVLKTEPMDDARRAEAVEIRDRLSAAGLDADRLFEQREIVMEQRRLADSEPNNEVVGQTIRMPGYLLPLEMDGQRAVEFLLVPTIGACIHTPPPPANQMVFVRYEEGFDVDTLYKPVWITGELQAKNQTQALHIVDGVAEIETTYLVQALSVEVYQ